MQGRFAPKRGALLHDHAGEDIGLEHDQNADQACEGDRVLEHETQDRALMSEPVGGSRCNDDRLCIDHLAHDAAGGVGGRHQDWRQTQLLRGDLLQVAEQDVGRRI